MARKQTGSESSESDKSVQSLSVVDELELFCRVHAKAMALSIAQYLDPPDVSAHTALRSSPEELAAIQAEKVLREWYGLRFPIPYAIPYPNETGQEEVLSAEPPLALGARSDRFQRLLEIQLMDVVIAASEILAKAKVTKQRVARSNAKAGSISRAEKALNTQVERWVEEQLKLSPSKKDYVLHREFCKLNPDADEVTVKRYISRLRTKNRD